MLGFLSGPRTGVELWFITLVHLDNSAGAAIVWYLALINLLLAVFNLLPAFPSGRRASAQVRALGPVGQFLDRYESGHKRRTDHAGSG